MQKIILIAIFSLSALVATAQSNLKFTQTDSTGLNFNVVDIHEDTTNEQTVWCSCTVKGGVIEIGTVQCTRTATFTEISPNSAGIYFFSKPAIPQPWRQKSGAWDATFFRLQVNLQLEKIKKGKN